MNKDLMLISNELNQLEKELTILMSLDGGNSKLPSITDLCLDSIKIRLNSIAVNLSNFYKNKDVIDILLKEKAITGDDIVNSLVSNILFKFLINIAIVSNNNTDVLISLLDRLRGSGGVEQELESIIKVMQAVKDSEE